MQEKSILTPDINPICIGMERSRDKKKSFVVGLV